MPDAKAITDAPDSLTVLMKQRRRWMNGALFGTSKVISNIGAMVSFGRNDHPWYRTIMMYIFMAYLLSIYLLNFLIIGITFSSIVLFLDYLIKTVFLTTNSPFFQSLAKGNLISEILFGAYLFLVLISIFVSVTLPIERAMPYFRVVALSFSILMTITMAGLIFFLSKQGFYMQELVWNPSTGTFEPV